MNIYISLLFATIRSVLRAERTWPLRTWLYAINSPS